MLRALTVLVALSVWLPAAAPAATVGGETQESEDGETSGVMHYRAGPGVANRVTVESAGDYQELTVTERGEPLRATGECRQVDPHSAVCPWVEDSFPIDLDVGDRADRVEIVGNVTALVHGGRGDDRLHGNGSELFGDGGDDRLIGGEGGLDRLHGGPGRDRFEGRGSSDRYLNDVFYDDETDAQAARDVYVGGRHARARISYAARTEPLRLDARKRRMGPDRDVVRGVRSITGGSGDDVLIGGGGPNELDGGPGEDRLLGRGGADRLSGDAGDDLMAGGRGADSLTEYVDDGEGLGRDRFVGGPGADDVKSVDGRTTAEREPDAVSCDAADNAVVSDAADRLRGGCRSVGGWDIADFTMRVRPTVGDGAAAFAVRCGVTEMNPFKDPAGFDQLQGRCRGTIELRGRHGEDYGKTTFGFDSDPGRSTAASVTVPLTPAGRKALRHGALVVVEAGALSSNGWNFTPAGFRAVLGR